MHVCNCTNACGRCGNCCRFCTCVPTGYSSTTGNVTITLTPAEREERVRSAARRAIHKFGKALERLADR